VNIRTAAYSGQHDKPKRDKMMHAFIGLNIQTSSLYVGGSGTHISRKLTTDH